MKHFLRIAGGFPFAEYKTTGSEQPRCDRARKFDTLAHLSAPSSLGTLARIDTISHYASRHQRENLGCRPKVLPGLSQHSSSSAVSPFPALYLPHILTLSILATCFFLGILFANFPYDYHVLWATPPIDPLNPDIDPRSPYFAIQETHLKFLYASPPLIGRILHLAIGTGLLGFMLKLYRPSDANLLFDGASLVLYMCGITVYIANIVRGLRTAAAGAYDGPPSSNGVDVAGGAESGGDYIGREDSLRVLAASHTILALVLVGVLVLQAGQWYAQRKEAEEIAEMDKVQEERRRAKGAAGKEGAGTTGGSGSGGSAVGQGKKKQ